MRDLDFLAVGDPCYGGATVQGTRPTEQGVVVRGFSFVVESIECRRVPIAGLEYAPNAAREQGLIELLVICTAWVRDRETGEPTRLLFQQRYHPDMGEPQAVRRMLHEMVCHEVDECMYVQGVRVYDPHREEQRQFLPRHPYDQSDPRDRF